MPDVSWDSLVLYVTCVLDEAFEGLDENNLPEIRQRDEEE